MYMRKASAGVGGLIVCMFMRMSVNAWRADRAPGAQVSGHSESCTKEDVWKMVFGNDGKFSMFGDIRIGCGVAIECWMGIPPVMRINCGWTAIGFVVKYEVSV